MPDYFAPYDTKVNFISEEEFKENHSKMQSITRRYKLQNKAEIIII
jgi:hypothetical protein